jgi:hypothetical protein
VQKQEISFFRWEQSNGQDEAVKTCLCTLLLRKAGKLLANCCYDVWERPDSSGLLRNSTVVQYQNTEQIVSHILYVIGLNPSHTVLSPVL